ncbi:MAG: diguanylate cyclase, partial [Planctomycetota bacterium]
MADAKVLPESTSILALATSKVSPGYPTWVREFGVLAAAAGVCIFYYLGEQSRGITMFLFFVPVIAAAFILGRYRACLVAMLCMVFVIFCGQPTVSLEASGVHTAVWAAMISLTAVLTGGLCDEKNRAIERLFEENHEGTFKDSLTQIANRRAFDFELERRFSEISRHPQALAIALIDVDHFKDFNDRFGHAAGDEILRQLASVVRANLRDSDLVARFGGEEFAIVLPRTEAAEAQVVAEKVRAAVADQWFEFGGSRYRITVSVGVASIKSEDSIERLTTRADIAMYTSKQSGRNCAHYHNGDDVVAFGDRLPATTSEPTADADGYTYLSKASGLPQCEVFTHELTRRVSEVHRYGGHLSVMSVKIIPADATPDEAAQLMQSVTAECIRNMLRIPDLATLYRSQQFAVMLPSTNLRNALVPALRLRQLVADCQKP